MIYSLFLEEEWGNKFLWVSNNKSQQTPSFAPKAYFRFILLVTLRSFQVAQVGLKKMGFF